MLNTQEQTRVDVLFHEYGLKSGIVFHSEYVNARKINLKEKWKIYYLTKGDSYLDTATIIDKLRQ